MSIKYGILMARGTRELPSRGFIMNSWPTLVARQFKWAYRVFYIVYSISRIDPKACSSLLMWTTFLPSIYVHWYESKHWFQLQMRENLRDYLMMIMILEYGMYLHYCLSDLVPMVAIGSNSVAHCTTQILISLYAFLINITENN